MKKNFLKVFSLLLVISMLAISVNAVVTDKPQSEITIAAPEQVTLYGDSATVTVTLTMPTCYAIEGQWTATDGLSMATLVADNGATLSKDGVVVWADVAGEDQNNWFKNPMGKMTATYTIPANATAGEYTVAFTCTVFAGGKQITAGEVEVWEGTFVYSKTIQVVQHECSDKTTDTDHICDDENCAKPYGDHSYTSVVTEPTCEDQGYTTYTCNCGDSYVDTYVDPKNHDWQVKDYTVTADTHIANYVCANDATHTKSDEAVAHTYDQEGDKCVCGAEKPAATGLKGDVNLDGVVNMSDFTKLAQHIGEVDTITDPVALANADVTGDGVVNMSDFTKLAQYIGEVIEDLN